MTIKSPRFHTIGQRYHDFEVTKVIEIAELQCQLIELLHLPTGAQILHIANDDPENLFCLSFQTLPNSSNGVAHILEHTVLCGSKKFPVKDPFFAMTRRSLNTFMNALTGADFTCYPAATQVPRDFYNLLDVYIDAVFHPNLNYYNFLQEGHRIEYAEPNNPESPLEYRGVVFNEMKGAMASASSRLHEILHSALFPNLTYGYNSGGDPKVIPSLTYEELKAFHTEFYHPSRCLFFFYGNMPLEEHLDFIAEHAFKGVVKVPPLPPIPLQPRFTEPRNITAYYPLPQGEPTENKTLIAFGWLTNHVLEQDELLALSILEVILLDTDASHLKKALLKSGLCKQVSSHLDSDLSEAPFVIILRGCNPDSIDAIEEVIRNSLEKVVATGISLQSVENALHQLEFHRSEITGDSGPFGLSLFMRAALLKQHAANPADGLMIHALSERLHKRNLADPTYLTGLIRKHLLDNKHFVRITMLPDHQLAASEIEEERQSLEQVKQSLEPEQRKKIVEQATSLAAFQVRQEDENEEVLPKLTLEDVPIRARDFSLVREPLGNLELFHHNTFTNGIIYADLVYALPYIVEENLYLVRLFALIISQMGCGGRNYADNLDYIQANLGGIGASLTFNLQANDAALVSPSFYIRGKALHRKAGKLFSLMLDMACSCDFSDAVRLREVIMKHFTALQSSLQQGSLRYALNLSASGLDVPSKIANQWYGLDYYYSIKKIAENIDKELPLLVENLHHLQNLLLGLENPHLVVTCESGMYDELKRHKFYGLADIPTKPSRPWKNDFLITPSMPQGRIISSPIAFIGKVFKTVPYAHEHAPALNVASYIFDNVVLHTKIREQGGAYGGGATCNSMSANFYFYSYRDPNINNTLDAFEEAVDKISKGKFDDSDLEEAKFEMIQSLDSPISPGSRGDVAYGWWCENKPHALRQKFRTAVLELTREQVIKAVKEEIIPNFASGTTVVFANQQLLDKENAILEARGKTPLILKTI